jgi:hypothetical protein
VYGRCKAGVEVDDDEDEEEHDANDNPMIYPTRFGVDRRNQQPPHNQQQSPERCQSPVGNAAGNSQVEGSHNQERTTLEIPQATWDKAKDAVDGRCIMGVDTTREELMAYQYFLHMRKRSLMKLKRDLDVRKKGADASSLRVYMSH